MKWVVELSEYDIHYETRMMIKAHVLTNFISEIVGHNPKDHIVKWTIHVDGSSNTKGSRDGVVLKSDSGLLFEQSLRFEFPTSNNQAGYEACLAR